MFGKRMIVRVDTVFVPLQVRIEPGTPDSGSLFGNKRTVGGEYGE